MPAHTAYDEIADWYDAQVRIGGLIHELSLPPLLTLAGDVAGQPICDLACGQGVVAQVFAQRGARVTGIDSSERLLDIARWEEAANPCGITYVHGDAQQLGQVADASFAVVVCHMALMDIPDLTATLNTVARILYAHGVFVFAITHPMLDTALSRVELTTANDGTPGRHVRSYFREGTWRGDNPNGVRGKVGAVHRTISTYLNSVYAAGLTVEQLVEPVATGELAQRLPHLQHVPGVLVVRCRKRDA